MFGCVLGVHGWGAWLGCMVGVHGWGAWLGCMVGVHGWVRALGCMVWVYVWGAWLGCMVGVHSWAVHGGVRRQTHQVDVIVLTSCLLPSQNDQLLRPCIAHM